MLGANGDVVSYNLYAYCGNNPIIREDKGGEFWNIVAGAIISTVTQVVDNLISGNDWHDGIVLAAASGAITGGMAATGAGVVAQAIVSGVVSAGTDLIDQAMDVGIEKVDWWQVGASAVAGVASGAVGGNGIQHKSGALPKAKGIYNYTVDKIKERFWTADKASTYLDLAAKNLQKVLTKELTVTTVRYAAGAVTATVAKKGMLALMN